MSKPIIFPELVSQMAERGVTQKQLAQATRLSEKAIYNKLRGLAPFTWPELCVIRRELFPDLSSDELFRTR